MIGDMRAVCRIRSRKCHVRSGLHGVGAAHPRGRKAVQNSQDAVYGLFFASSGLPRRYFFATNRGKARGGRACCNLDTRAKTMLQAFQSADSRKHFA